MTTDITLHFQCPPCRGFTPSLVKTFNKLKESAEAQKKDFQIVFASSDRDEKSFKEYFGEMPWLALPFGDSRKEKLSDFCNVEGMGANALPISHVFLPYSQSR